MRTVNASLVTLLNSRNVFTMCDLLRIELLDGTVLRYSGGDRAVAYGGFNYVTTVGFKRERTRLTISLEIDSLNVSLIIDTTTLLGSVPLARAVADGAFDGARVTLFRAFFDPAQGGTLVDAITLFEGEVGGVDPGSTEVRLSVESELGKLNVKVPANVVSPGCIWAVYSPGCGVVKATYQVNKTAAGGSTASVLVMNADAQPNQFYRLGVIVFTSGANIGLRRAVRDHTGLSLTLSIPLPSVPTVGDAFTLYPGCDKNKTTCNDKFSNLGRFRGFPYVPKPEDAR